MRFLDPKNDLIFKKVFGEHPHLPISFLNALLPLGENEQIESLEHLPAELIPELPFQKNTLSKPPVHKNQGYIQTVEGF